MTVLDENHDEIIDKIATPKASLLLIKMLKEEGETESVIKACLKALEFFPDDIEIRKLLTETYLEQGSVEPAELELEKLCNQINKLSSIFKVQAELYKKEGRIEEAINSLKLYLAHNSSDQDAADLLSELSAPAKEEPSVLPTSTLAEIYYKQGELEEAIKIYEQVVKAFPDDEKYKTRLNELRDLKESEEQRKSAEEILKQKKLKMITILERWLDNIEQRKAVNLAHQP